MKRISEYVSLGHPDKTADYISEYLLDRYIEKDPETRYAVEVQIKDNHVTLGGEVTSKAKMTPDLITDYVRKAVDRIGYTKEYAERWNGQCICSSNIQVDIHISQQSPDIAQGVNENNGWGDQGIFFGYADYNGPQLLPADHQLAKRICDALYQKAKAEPDLGWGIDIKTQVVMPEDSDQPEKVIVAIPLRNEGDKGNLVRGEVLLLLGKGPCEIIVNGTGAYYRHSAMADCGTTGRKLAVDFYGGNCRIGGGSPWTKDGSKADLTLNLYARHFAIKAAHKFKTTITISLGCCIGKKDVDYSIYNEAGETLEEGTLPIDPFLLRRAFHLDTPIYAYMCEAGLFGYAFEWNKWSKQ